MIRRKARYLLAVALCVALVGCADLPAITEQQSDLIAEYAGGVLLRYSHRYDLRLVKQDVDEDGVEDSASAVSGGAVATEEPTASPAKPTASPESTSEPDKPDESTEPEATEEPTVSLNDLYNIKGLDFKYKYSKFTNKYPEKSDAVEITPEKGEILYVVAFGIKNTGKKAVKINLTERPFHYELSIDGDTVLPTLSLLPNGGLNYLMTTIKPGKTEEAVLIFNLAKSKKGTKDNVLSITEGSNTAKINL